MVALGLSAESTQEIFRVKEQEAPSGPQLGGESWVGSLEVEC